MLQGLFHVERVQARKWKDLAIQPWQEKPTSGTLLLAAKS